jgi:MFS family permease
MNDRILIYASAFLRSMAVGSLKIFLGFYILALGMNNGDLGVIVSAGLFGVMAGTLAASTLGDRFGRRRSLALLLLINMGGAIGLYFFSDFVSLAVVCFLGMINGMGKERGAAVALESAALPQTADAKQRTRVFAWYNALIDIGQAVGSRMGALPVLLRDHGVGSLDSYRYTFVAYAVIMAAALLCTLMLSPQVELGERKEKVRLTPEAKKIIVGFSALSWLDSFGSGFIVGSLFTVWIAKRFNVDEDTIGWLMLAGNVANAISHFGAAWLSERIGLVNTMVFTHIPSNLFLMALAFAPKFEWAVVLYLARELLVEMDVPTRQSYLVSVVKPEERSAASGYVGVARNLGWASAPNLAGWAMDLFKGTVSAVGPAPVVIAGTLKIIYDLALWRSFRNIKPPEENS